VKQIGRELNVRYVLEGSVQRGGNRLRINVQLIDAESGTHLWAERFDKPVADLFDLQDEIVARLANQLGTQLILSRRAVQKRPRTPTRWTSIFGVWLADNVTAASVHFERALERDPGNIEALLSAAFADYVRCIAFLVNDRKPLLAAAVSDSDQSIIAGP
jgi:hypothetical protein